MRKEELRMNEQEKYEVIKELVDHNGNKNRAQFRRLLYMNTRRRGIVIIKKRIIRISPGFS